MSHLTKKELDEIEFYKLPSTIALQKKIYFAELRDYERSYLDVDVKTRKFKQESS